MYGSKPKLLVETHYPKPIPVILWDLSLPCPRFLRSTYAIGSSWIGTALTIFTQLGSATSSMLSVWGKFFKLFEIWFIVHLIWARTHYTNPFPSAILVDTPNDCHNVLFTKQAWGVLASYSSPPTSCLKARDLLDNLIKVTDLFLIPKIFFEVYVQFRDFNR